MDRVVVSQPYVGLVAMQVCAVKDASDEEILAVCDRDNPAGTTMGWCSVLRKLDPDCVWHKPNLLPVQCSDHPDRMHYLCFC
jgi:hypothetical protein